MDAYFSYGFSGGSEQQGSRCHAQLDSDRSLLGHWNGSSLRLGLKKDLGAVVAAVETRWSNGQVEGQINRLKAIKR
jgi:transposase